MSRIFISKHAKDRFYRRFPELAYKTSDPYSAIIALIKAGTRERCNKATSPYNGIVFRNGCFVAIARRMNKKGKLCVTTIVREHTDSTSTETPSYECSNKVSLGPTSQTQSTST